MTATDELRRMLDERGVEWWNQTDPEPQTATMARLGDQLIEYRENVNGTMGYHVWNMCDLTPEQAIAATLGRGECHVKAVRKLGDSFGFKLSCGHSMVNPFDDHPDYCPWCRAKVVDDG